MPQLNYLYTNPAWEHLLLMESHVMGSETISDRAMGECGSQPWMKRENKRHAPDGKTCTVPALRLSHDLKGKEKGKL